MVKLPSLWFYIGINVCGCLLFKKYESGMMAHTGSSGIMERNKEQVPGQPRLPLVSQENKNKTQSSFTPKEQQQGTPRCFNVVARCVA